ncbi:MAG: ATP-grasp domain-containing protein [Clostridia bacterium]|nr:ATP-grasp domain-containing protein [Clostridia bacterium]
MKKILILGGANLHCKLVKAAKEMGLYTIVTDYLENSPAKQIADKSYMLDIKDVDGIVQMCKEENVEAVISTYLDPCQRYYYQICEALKLPCYIGTWEQVYTLTDKEAFKACCQKYGVDIIPTYEENQVDIEYPVLVKPAHSRGSRGQTICNSYDEISKAVEIAKKESGNGKAIIEKYMGNKNDFTMTYIFKDGEPYLTKTSDRYLGSEECGLEKVCVIAVSPSKYTDTYKKNVENRLLNMLKGIGIKNGPVFMQGFIDNDTVRFYDPGYRFPGSEYDTLFEKIWNIDIMKMMINYALCGKMTNEYGELSDDLVYLKGKNISTMFPTVCSGKISDIRGLEVIKEMPELVCYTIRHEVGEFVHASRDVNQRIAEFDFITDSATHLKDTVVKVLETLCVLDENGENMLSGNVDPNSIY